jgi:hypothetical protein
VEINGAGIPGGITAGSARHNPPGFDVPVWTTHSLVVQANLLNEQNVLHIRAATAGGIDNFIIDNVVIFFKTRS